MLKLIRAVLRKLILFFDARFAPRPIGRAPEEQARVERESAGLVLFQFEACPFCVKVRRAIRRLGLRVDLRDARAGTPGGAELVQGGGQAQVPCLRIAEGSGSTRWLYESAEIIAYLEKRFAPGGPPQ